MQCNWCGQGEGSNRTIDRKTNKTFYYYCSDCIGFINKELNPMSAFYRERDKRNFRRMKIEVLERNFKRLQHFLDIHLRGHLGYPMEYLDLHVIRKWGKELKKDKEEYKIGN